MKKGKTGQKKKQTNTSVNKKEKEVITMTTCERIIDIEKVNDKIQYIDQIKQSYYYKCSSSEFHTYFCRRKESIFYVISEST